METTPTQGATTVPMVNSARRKRKPAALTITKPNDADGTRWSQLPGMLPKATDSNIAPDNLEITVKVSVRGRDFVIYEDTSVYPVPNAMLFTHHPIARDQVHNFLYDHTKHVLTALGTFWSSLHRKRKELPASPNSKAVDVEVMPTKEVKLTVPPSSLRDLPAQEG